MEEASSCTHADRRIADDVGCYVQKVAKFGEKLEKQNLIDRVEDGVLEKFIYFDCPGPK